MFRMIEARLDDTKSRIIAQSLVTDVQKLAHGILAEMGVRPRKVQGAKRRKADLQTDYITLKNAINKIQKVTEKEDLILALQDMADSANGILKEIS